MFIALSFEPTTLSTLLRINNLEQIYGAFGAHAVQEINQEQFYRDTKMSLYSNRGCAASWESVRRREPSRLL